MVKSFPCENYVDTSIVSSDMMLLGYGGDNTKFIVVVSTGWQMLRNLCGDYLDTSFVGPGTELLGYGGDGNKFTVMEATCWHVVNNLTCRARSTHLSSVLTSRTSATVANAACSLRRL